MGLLWMVMAAARDVHPIGGPKDVLRRVRFIARAMRHRRLIRGWREAGGIGGLSDSLVERPKMLGVVEWPYLHKDWGVAQRFGAIGAHYAELEGLAWLRVGMVEGKVLCELGDLLPGLRVVLDRPEWFLREGELTINLFIGETRVYSLAFVLGRHEGRRAAYVGAVQGRDLENIEAVYRDLTKKLYGARPRDFLFTVFQVVCVAAGVGRVFAVSDACRHHRHAYFGAKAGAMVGANYDAIWADRGGVASGGGFFELPVAPSVRAESEIPSHKRSMYRKRYALFDRVRADVERVAGVG